MNRFIYLSQKNGASIDLTTFVDDVAFRRGASGLIGGPPVRRRNEYVPGQPGAVNRQTVHDIKKVVLPLHASAAGYIQMMELVRRMVLLMDPEDGSGIGRDGILRYIPDVGNPSDLFCSVINGLEIDALGELGPSNQQFAIELEAVDPYWYGPVQRRVFKAGEEGETPWFGPGLFPDLTLGRSSVIGDVVIDVQTDVPTYPLWTVTGVGSNLKLDGGGPNRLFEMSDDSELLAGEVIVVDTRYRGDTAKTVTGPGATEEERNWFPRLLPNGRALWPLLPGLNPIGIRLAGSEPGSSVLLEWRNARKTP